MHYPYYEPLIAPAREKNEIWRVIVGCLLGTVIYYISTLYFLSLVAGTQGMSTVEYIACLTEIISPSTTAITLFSFVFMMLPVFLITETLHKRRWHTLFAPWRMELKVFIAVTSALLTLGLAIELLPPWTYSLLEWNPNLGFARWVVLLPVALLAVLIQTGAEELVFRGYLQSQLAARFNSPWVWMVIPSAIFGYLHYDPATWGDGAIWPVLWAFVFGLCAADVVARSGTLAAGIAFHFVNNLYPLVWAGIPDYLSGFALFHLPWTSKEMLEANPMLLTDFLFVVCSWLMIRLVLRR